MIKKSSDPLQNDSASNASHSKADTPVSAAEIRREVVRRLTELADEAYRKFQCGLVPGKENILGVRIPKLRGLAKEIIKQGINIPGDTCHLADWREYLAAATGGESRLSSAPSLLYEEIMLLGLVTGSAKMPFDELLSRTAAFVPLIDNWAVCDVFCGTLKAAQKHPDEMWTFLQPYLALGKDRERQSDRETEFSIRFAVVMLLSYYIKEDYIDRVLGEMDEIRHDGYYVKMAVAWTISICFVKFPDKTMALLQNNHLDDFTHNKAIQKTIESFRVDQETKALLRTMKRK